MEFTQLAPCGLSQVKKIYLLQCNGEVDSMSMEWLRTRQKLNGLQRRE